MPNCFYDAGSLFFIRFFVQAIKQKLQIHRNRSITVDGERPSPQEEDKAKMLFGNRHAVSHQHSNNNFI